METTKKNNRNSLRMNPENDRAGIVVRNRAVRVQLLNQSTTGCGFRTPKKHKLAVGDTIRVATSHGQFESVVRRVEPDQNDPHVVIVGVEYRNEIKQKTKRGSAFSMFKGDDPRHAVGGGGSASSVMIVLCWVAIGLVAAGFFVGFENIPFLRDIVR